MMPYPITQTFVASSDRLLGLVAVFVTACSAPSSSSALPSSSSSLSSASGERAHAPIRASPAIDDFVRRGGVYTLDKPSPDALDVEVSWTNRHSMTHVADRVSLHGRSGDDLRIETPEDAFELGRPVAPLLEIERSVDRDSVLLLGWSSQGGGLETYHTMIVTNVAPRIVGSLEFTDSRGSVGIVVSGSRVGIPIASSPYSELAVGARHWDRAALDQLTYASPPPGATFYAAPFRHDEARSRAAKYAWFDLAETPPSSK